MAQELASRLKPGCLLIRTSEPWLALASVQMLTIPKSLPQYLWPMLGKWLQTEGRLAQVTHTLQLLAGTGEFFRSHIHILAW